MSRRCSQSWVSARKSSGCEGHDAFVDAYLGTECLALRRFTADDADLLIELDSDPAVMRYLTGGEPTAVAACAELNRVRQPFPTDTVDGHCPLTGV